MSEAEKLRNENRRLRAETLRAREDLEHERERLAYALRQVAELRARLPGRVKQLAAPGAEPQEKDPLERFMEAIRPSRRD